MFLLILTIGAVVLGSALCSGTEAALFSAPMIKVRKLAQSGKRMAKTLLHIRENMGRPIVTIVIFNNLFNIVGTFLVAAAGRRAFGAEYPFEWIISLVLTLLIIIFAEVIPKTLGEQHAMSVAPFVALPVRGLSLALTPVIWCMEKAMSPFIRDQAYTTDEAEIMLLAKMGHKQGVLDKKESELIQRVFELDAITASRLMTPRLAMTCLEKDAVLQEISEEIISSQHTRIVVIDGSRDNVAGLVLKADLLAAIVRGEGGKTVGDIAGKVRFVPGTIHADQLLDLFQRTRHHLAVVSDEYGGVSGVVTLEDVLEILTGEIVDETDITVDLQETARRMGRKPSADGPAGE